ncbi:MAG: outer membrane protein assembly factor BamE [Caulobacteraceae bacterium]
MTVRFAPIAIAPIALAPIVLAAGVLTLSACAPVNSYEGYQAIDQNPSAIKVGEDTRATVLAKLGSPTSQSTFDKNTWFYITQVQSQTAFYDPRVTRRDVVAISFDKSTDTVAAVKTLGLKDGRQIAYNSRKTPTRGRQLSIIEQLIGSIGTASALPPNDNFTPSSHPGEP